jgi:hypothetical protein
MATDVKDKPTVLSRDLRSFLTATPARYAVIAVANPDGSPHQNVVWFLFRSDESGDVLILNSRRGRHWPTNLERERVAGLAVHNGEEAVTLRCEVVEIYGGEQAQGDAAEMALRYDPPERANPRLDRFRTEDRLSFVLRPTRVRTHGDPH